MIKDKVNDIEVNIINVNDPEDLVLVKSVFEEFLKLHDKIKDTLTIADFLNNYIDITSNIFIDDILSDKSESVGFNVHYINNMYYVFITDDNNASKKLIYHLSNIKYDVSKIKRYDINDNIVNPQSYLLRINGRSYVFDD